MRCKNCFRRANASRYLNVCIDDTPTTNIQQYFEETWRWISACKCPLLNVTCSQTNRAQLTSVFWCTVQWG